MDAIKSYFSKIMSQSHVMRKGSGKWKRDRSKDSGRFGRLPYRSASTSHVDLDSNDPDMDAISMGSLRMFTPTLDTFRSPQRDADRGRSLNSQQSRRDMTRTPPPSKPPRRDLVFSVQLDTEGLNDIGVEIDSLPTQGNTSTKHKSLEADTSKNEDRNSLTTQHDSSTGNPPRSHGLTFKVMALTQGSRCNLDGRVKVNDEIVDINGESLQKETRESARVLLEKAIKSGHVVLTIRRRRKRAAGPPAVPTRQTSLLQSSHRTWSASSDDLYSTELSSAPNGFTSSSNVRTRSLDDSLVADAVLLEDLNVDLNVSSDDVFLDSSAPQENVTYANLPNLRFNKNKTIRTNQRLPDIVRNDTAKHDKADSISASGDVSSCSSKASDDSPRRVHVVLRAVGKPLRRCSSTSTLVDEFDSKIESSSSSRKESVESTECTNGHGEQSVPERKSDRVTTALPAAANVLRQSDNSQNKESDTAQQMNMSTHEHDSEFPNSPSSKKRMVSKLNLLKDENGLGIHIAGGKGSKKGDIGIFIAALTEGGAADRDGRLKKGDELLMINGYSLEGLSHQEAVDVLRNSEHLVKIVIASKIKKSTSVTSSPYKIPDSPKMVSHKHNLASPGDQKCKLKLNHLRRPNQAAGSESKKSGKETIQMEKNMARPQGLELQPGSESHGRQAASQTKQHNVDDKSPCGTTMKWEEYFEKFQPVQDKTVLQLIAPPHHAQHRQPVSIMIPKGAGGMGLGFSVTVDPDLSTGKSGIFVEKIFRHGGIAKDGRLNEGDELLGINDQPVSGMTHEAVMSLFRSLKQGLVKVTFRPRTPSSKRTSSRTTHSESLEGSPASTPDHPPYTSLQNAFNVASAATINKPDIHRQQTQTSSFSNKQSEKQNSSNSKCDGRSYQMPPNTKHLPSAKNDYNVVEKQCLPKEPLLSGKHNFCQKPVDKGRVGVVTPLPNQSEGGSSQRKEHFGHVYSNQHQSHNLPMSQVIKPQDNSTHNQKKGLSCHKENHNNLESKCNNQQAELEQLLQNCTEKHTTSLPYGIVSSPKSSSVIKMQVRPVETHVAQSSPVMNLHSFKPAGIAVKYPPSEKDQTPSKQAFSTPTAKRKEYSERGDDKSTKSETRNSADGIMRLAETRIHPDYKKVDSPTVRPKVNHNAQTVTHKSVDRVDQQLHENRKQIDISSPIIGQRRNYPSASTQIKELTEPDVDTFSAHSKTLPRLHHQNPVESCHHHHQQTAAIENMNEQKISTVPISQKLSESPLSPGCYSSLPRGHHHPHHNHQPAEHCQVCHNQQSIQHNNDNSIHSSNIPNTGKSFFHGPHHMQSQFSATDLLLPDLMRQNYPPQLSIKPFDNTALTFFNHNQAFSRLHPAPNSLAIDKHSQFSNFNSSAFHQDNNVAISPTAAFKSFTQASFYKYQSKEATATYQNNSSSEKQSHTVFGNSQSFSNMVHPQVSVNSPDLLSNSMLSHMNLPQVVSATRMTESAYGDFSSQTRNHQNFNATKEKLAWLQDMCNWHRYEVPIIKEAGITFGINIVRKTVAGTSNIFIQDIIPGSNVEKDGRLRKGDCILSVNRIELKDFTLLDAYELFRTLPSGPVHVVAIRDMAHTTV